MKENSSSFQLNIKINLVTDRTLEKLKSRRFHINIECITLKLTGALENNWHESSILSVKRFTKATDAIFCSQSLKIFLDYCT